MKTIPRGTMKALTVVACGAVGATILSSCCCLSSAPDTSIVITADRSMDLLQQIHGTLVLYDHPTVTLVRLPEVAVSNFVAPDYIRTVAGPIDGAVLAHLSGDVLSYYQVALWNLSEGTERTVLRRNESWFDGLSGNSIALSADGTFVIFAAKASEGNTDYDQTILEVWDTRSTNLLFTIDGVIDNGMSFVSNSTVFVYCAATRRKRLDAALQGPTEFGRFKDEECVPLVIACDAVSKKKRFVHVGWHPCVSSDGTTMIIDDSDRNACLVDLASGETKRTWVPDDFMGAVSLVGKDLLIYKGVMKSPERGYTIGIADLRTHTRQTIVEGVQRRHIKSTVSFGTGSFPMP